MENSGSNLRTFLIKVGVVSFVLILIMFLARLWFFPTPGDSLENRTSRNSSDNGNGNDSKEDASQKIISWQDAGNYIGDYITVEGTIVATHNSGKACFLNFHKNYKKYFTAVIFKSAFPDFPAHPEDYYKDQKVRVTGTLKEYQGKPEIILNSPEQIEIIN